MSTSVVAENCLAIIVLSEVSQGERQSHLQFRVDVQGYGGHSVSEASEHLWQENQKS